MMAEEFRFEGKVLEAVRHCRAMLAALGIDGAHDGRTPTRYVRALAELTRGLRVDPREHLATQFPPVSAEPGIIVVQGVPFTSVCEHHILPFHGTATVAYLPKPGADIVGLSKLARLVAEYAARPQVQERLTEQVVSAIMDELPAAGAAAVVRGTHTCMGLRGACTGMTAAMVTTAVAGELRQHPHVTQWQIAAAPLLSGSPTASVVL